MMGSSTIKRYLLANQALRNQSGYSMIEVAITMAVFAIGALTVCQLLILTFQSNKTGNEITQATLLAEARMESLKNAPDISILTSAVEPNINHYGQPGGIYTRTTSITNPTGGDYSRQIVVTVQWVTKGRMRRVTLNSLTHGNGI
jgi:prepilin-type N-terminal cleavage/methylation domain-containing protein